MEKIANLIVQSVPIDKINSQLRDRIESFLDDKEKCDVITAPEGASKCVSCPKNCSNNGKSIICTKCNRFQHFQCAGVKTADERGIFSSGDVPFICSKCLANPGNAIAISGSVKLKSILKPALNATASADTTAGVKFACETTDDTTEILQTPKITPPDEKDDPKPPSPTASIVADPSQIDADPGTATTPRLTQILSQLQIN